MPYLSENYHLRKCYLQQDRVPTQTVMKKKMSPALAAVYFKSMTPKLKVIAGLEPSLKGGGSDWYVDPKELLEGRAVLKPIGHDVLSKLSHTGIESIGSELYQKRRKALDIERDKTLFELDINWRRNVALTILTEREDLEDHAANKNSEHITEMLNCFAYLYRRSINKIENLFHGSAIAEIKRTRENVLRKMQNKYSAALNSLSSTSYETYEDKILKVKTKLRAEFMEKLETHRSEMGDKIHDINVDKHMAIEQLRHVFECQNLACQIYVALKEREECEKQIGDSKYKHKKTAKLLTDKIILKDFEINLKMQKENKRKELNIIWQRKVFHVVKNFQMFVSYCLSMLPSHAEFFINMEKLMLLQVNEALENPSAESIIEVDEDQFKPPIPKPKPFYVFCDKKYQTRVNPALCPIVSSSHSLMPAIIVNKRCLYSACDNFEQFTSKIKDHIYGNRGVKIKDDLIYENFVPVKYTESQQLFEIKLASSLVQVLQDEMAYMRTVPVQCDFCELPWCSCTQFTIKSADATMKTKPASSLTTNNFDLSDRKLSLLTEVTECDHKREPKWERYIDYVQPKRCSCRKRSKKHLLEHLPAYMTGIKVGPPDIPNYETCSVATLKRLVKEARAGISSAPAVVMSKPKDVTTQYSDIEFETLCNCFSDAEVGRLVSGSSILALTTIESWDRHSNLLGGDVSSTFITQRASSFATARAHSLRNLLNDLPDLQELFQKKKNVSE